MNLRRSLMKRLVRLSGTSGLKRYGIFKVLDALGYKTVEVASYDDFASAKLPEVAGASVSEVSGPRQLDEPAVVHRETVPPLHPLVFSDVTVRSDSSVLCQGRHGFTTAHAVANRHRISWENGRSCAFDSGGRLAFETRPEERIPKGICGFGEASYNWYHWLIEILPTIMMAQKLDAGYDDLPLLVPEEALTNATFRETLAFFQGNREIVSLKKTHQYRVGELIFIPPPAYGPFNMHRGYWPNPSDYSQNIDVLKQFRMRILDQLALPKKNDGPRRIFLARPANARQYNQDELTNAAHDMGFDIVRMETLSFREQAHLLHAADLVVGPSGAAWAGSLFMRPGTKGLAWVLKEYKGGSFFSNLSCVSGSQLAYLLVDADQDISGTHDAIAAPYTVPVDTFVQHVKALET